MRIALITGGAKGIGYHLAEGFAKNGFKVIVIDIIEGKYDSDNIDFYKADLKNEKEIKRYLKGLLINMAI